MIEKIDSQGTPAHDFCAKFAHFLGVRIAFFFIKGEHFCNFEFGNSWEMTDSHFSAEENYC